MKRKILALCMSLAVIGSGVSALVFAGEYDALDDQWIMDDEDLYDTDVFVSGPKDLLLSDAEENDVIDRDELFFDSSEDAAFSGGLFTDDETRIIIDDVDRSLEGNTAVERNNDPTFMQGEMTESIETDTSDQMGEDKSDLEANENKGSGTDADEVEKESESAEEELEMESEIGSDELESDSQNEGTSDEKKLVDYLTLIPDTTFVYNGEAQIPQIVVKVLDENMELIDLTEGFDYQIRFMNQTTGTEDVINAGVIDVTVEGMGEYTGIVEGSYTIVPCSIGEFESMVAGE